MESTNAVRKTHAGMCRETWHFDQLTNFFHELPANCKSASRKLINAKTGPNLFTKNLLLLYPTPVDWHEPTGVKSIQIVVVLF